MEIHNDMKGNINGKISFSLAELKLLHALSRGSEPFHHDSEPEEQAVAFIKSLEHNLEVMIANMEK
jgi:hypothetical protein